MKRNFIFGLTIFCGMLVAFGCRNSNDSAQGNTEEMLDAQERIHPQDGNAENVSQKVYKLSSVELQEFAKEASSEAQKVILMAQIAIEEARRKEVREFAEAIKNAHLGIGRELENIVATNNWYLPDTLMSHHQRGIAQLQDMAGPDFDSYYLKNLVSAHERIIEKYENVSEKSGDSKMAAWARSALPALRQHLEKGRMLFDGIEEAS